jgi:hypothetical protein
MNRDSLLPFDGFESRPARLDQPMLHAADMQELLLFAEHDEVG